MDQNLNETIQKALEAATPGPWHAVKNNHDRDGYHVSRKPGIYGNCITGWGRVVQSKEDAHLIANAPEWLRALLEENELLRSSKLDVEHNRNLLSSELQQTREELEQVKESRDKWEQGYNRKALRLVEVEAENERLRSIEHTLCLTIGEADKALQQTREELEDQRERANIAHSNAEAKSARLAELHVELEQVKAERDKALAYPTIDAYETVCKALWKHRDDAESIRTELAEKNKVLEWYAEEENHKNIADYPSSDVYVDSGSLARIILDQFKGESLNEPT